MKKLLLYMFLMAASIPLFAYDFSATNAKGDTLYYNVTSDSTVEVTYDMKVYRPTRFNFKGHIVIPSVVNYETKSYSVTRIGDMAFMFCPLIDSVTIPEGVETVGRGAFRNCSSLRWVSNFPFSLREMGESAFNACDSIMELHFTSPYCQIGGSAFAGCGSLQEVTLPFRRAVLDGEQCFYGDTNLRRVRMPDSMEVIPNSAFENCWRLDSIVIPAGVYRMGYHAFAYCRCLVSVQFSTPAILDSLGFGAFENCNSLPTMDLSQTKIRVLSRKSFAYCPSLRELKLPTTLNVVADYCLLDAKSIRYLIVPEQVKQFSYNATWIGGFGLVTQDSLPVRINFILQSHTPPNLYMYSFNDFRYGTDSFYFHLYKKDTFYVPCGYEQVYRNATDRNWIIVANVREASYAGKIFLDSVCGPEVQQRYGFYPDHSGDYCEKFNHGYACDSIAIFHVTLATRPTVDDSSVQIEPNKQDTSVLWTWEGTGYAYNVYRDGDYITTVEQPSYLDTNIEFNVQYCYNFAPVNERYCEGKWSTTNCYTMLELGVKDAESSQPLAIYPNPAKKALFLTNGERYENIPYEITDVTGRMVLQGNYNAAEGINVGNLAKGVYLLRIENRYRRFVKH